MQRVMDSGICASALIYAPPTDFNPEDSRVKIAFDADAVIFSDESECRFKKEGMDAFYKYLGCEMSEFALNICRLEVYGLNQEKDDNGNIINEELIPLEKFGEIID